MDKEKKKIGCFNKEILVLETMNIENEKLYKDVRETFDKNIRSGKKSVHIMGNSSSDRNIIELGKTLTGVRQTGMNIVKETVNIKKLEFDIDIKREQLGMEQDNQVNFGEMVRNFMGTSSGSGVNADIIKNVSISSGSKGLDQLNNTKAKLSKTDREMIIGFKSGGSNGST